MSFERKRTPAPRFRGWLGCALFLAAPAVARAEVEPPQVEVPEEVRGPSPPLAAPASWAIQSHLLPNGLRVVLQEEHSWPNVAVCVTYDVGSRNEQEGRSGFAHLFEHLMFQGSRHVEKGGHFQAIAARGGRANGTTNKERTNYFQVLPKGQLPLALWLEADRMRGLALGQETFENQRRVVQEEYRKRYDNRVFARGALRLSELVFQGDPAYEHPTIGTLEDLDEARLEWAREFHRQYYQPRNAVLTVVGDFDSKAALTLIEEYFGELNSTVSVPRFEPTERVFEQASERFLVMVDEAAKTPALFLGWAIPSGRSRERLALELASEVLTGGESGRLHQSLVIEKASALTVESWTANERGPGLFAIQSVVAPLSNVDTVQKWLDGELKRLRLIGPSQAELDRARARLELHTLRQLETNQARAIRLGEYQLFHGDAGLLQQDLGRHRGISTDEVRRAAHRYLTDNRRSIVEVYPPGWTRDLGPVITTTSYVVQKGDTLSGIANKHGTSAAAIAKENRINPKRPIHPGQRLLVTLGSGGSRVITKKHEVKRGDTLIGIAKKYGTTATAIAKENKLSTKRPIYPGQELTITLEVANSRGKTSSSAKKSNRKAAPKAAPSKSKSTPKGRSKATPSKPAPARPAPRPPAKKK